MVVLIPAAVQVHPQDVNDIRKGGYMDSDKVLIMTTASSFDEASEISRLLLEKQLAACCSIIQNVQSTYWWKGKIVEDAEVILLIKSLKSVEQKIIEAIKFAHSYEVPEIICIPIIGGYKPYFEWIDNTISRK